MMYMNMKDSKLRVYLRSCFALARLDVATSGHVLDMGMTN